MPHHVTIKSSPDVIKHLYCNHWHHIRVQSTEQWKSLKSWEYYNLWAFDIKGNLVYKHNIYQRYKIMQHRPHLLCKFYVGLTSKLEKLVMVKFCSLMRLTSVKVLKKHVQIKAIASFVHLHISRIDEIPVHLGKNLKWTERTAERILCSDTVRNSSHSLIEIMFDGIKGAVKDYKRTLRINLSVDRSAELSPKR